MTTLDEDTYLKALASALADHCTETQILKAKTAEALDLDHDGEGALWPDVPVSEE